MRQLTLIFIACFFVTSCGNQNTEQKAPAAKESNSLPSQTTTANGQLQADPVCEMPRDSSWTDYTIYNNDTLWFCSEGCKKAFMARPDKYIKNTNNKDI